MVPKNQKDRGSWNTHTAWPEARPQVRVSKTSKHNFPGVSGRTQHMASRPPQLSVVTGDPGIAQDSRNLFHDTQPQPRMIARTSVQFISTPDQLWDCDDYTDAGTTCINCRRDLHSHDFRAWVCGDCINVCVVCQEDLNHDHVTCHQCFASVHLGCHHVDHGSCEICDNPLAIADAPSWIGMRAYEPTMVNINPAFSARYSNPYLSCVAKLQKVNTTATAKDIRGF